MKKVFIAAVGVCLGWSLLMGSAPVLKVGMSNEAPRYVGLSNDIAGRMGGENDADFDTVTVLFTYQPDTTTNVNAHTEFLQAWRDAGSAENVAKGGGMIDLATPANGFAFCLIDSAAANSSIKTIDANSYYRVQIKSSAAVGDRWKLTSASRRLELFRIPFEDFIPTNSQIVSAKVKRIASGTAPVGVADSMSSTLMTIPADNVWYTDVGITDPVLVRGAHATWQHQIATLGAQGYPAPGTVGNDTTWVPAIANRNRFWDWGDYTDWSGRPQGSTTAIYTEWDQNITNCVQAAVNGAVNNGIVMAYSDGSASVEIWENFSWCAIGPGAQIGEKNRPWVEVKFLTRAYRSPWPNGHDFAFAIQCDDGRKKINDALIADLGARTGGKYTTFVTRGITQSPDGTYISWSDLLTAARTGVVEVGSHSFYSWSTAEGQGLNHYAAKGAIAAADQRTFVEWSLGLYPDTLTAAASVIDTLYYDVDPTWMTYEATAAGFSDLVGAGNFAQSFGVPVANHNPWAQKALFDVGYKGVRILNSASAKYDAEGNRTFYTLGFYRPAESDTVYQGLRINRAKEPRNLRMIASSVSIESVVGDTTANYSQAQITYNIKNIIENQRAKGTRYVGFLVHDVKASGDGPGAYNTSSADPDELGWIFDVVDTYGGPYMTITEVAEWLSGNSTVIATPVGYAQADSFGASAAQKFWGQTDGVDDAFIPGVE